MIWRELAKNRANRKVFDRYENVQLPPPEAGREWSPYWHAGSHPDCVERVWNTLGDTLPEDCKFLALGRPVLAHPRSGFVFAMPYGTAYALWLPEPQHNAARAAGLRATHSWSTGPPTDIADELGEGWLFGAWDAREVEWVKAAYAAAADQ